MSDHVPFYLTRAGRQFYEKTVPELVEQLKRLNDTLAALVERLDAKKEPPCHT